ncbi:MULTISPECIES: N-acetylmuramoyl-L-alanine amidase [Vitreoscilla]|uniref:N-acetylmuramoyl-L-alanine amidase n=1 Tax=Vitreoscilla stercoraria TaxID=61 RepID=A0ABY4EBE4_VITST|nr:MULTISPECIES: N-acetylmuramoyl-L-alanine amidase [Vitreoscilla]AUZ05516.1 N-acetylmuramoyl-L-alanine amidase [Vitreoscilla sp. C1]UOO93071.1 N-acetylmuramoyl-L-alanine amidase [Vitreoscilla stercoraria]
MLRINRRGVLQVLGAGACASLTPKAFANNAQVVATRLWPSDLYTRMTLEVSAGVPFKYFTLDNPSRLVVDVSGISINEVLKSMPSKVLARDPFIQSIRVGQFNDTTVRIVMDLKRSVSPQVFSLLPAAEYKHRLVVDLFPTASAGVVQEEEEDALMALLKDYSTGQVKADGSTTAKAQTNIPKPQDTRPKATPENKTQIKRQIVIVIDPGHGGEDPGAIGPSGLREKDVVLAVSRELKKKLDSMGYKTHMTRNQDVFIPLGVRVATARKLQADLFISVHADAFTSPQPRGTGVYALSTGAATSTLAKHLADTQNASDLVGGVKKVGDRNVDQTLLDMTQTATIRDSLILGKYVLNALGRVNKLHKGHVDQAGFAVLKAPDIPSILVECAFISNPEEERLLSTSGFRVRVADAIAGGVKNYFDSGVALAQR